MSLVQSFTEVTHEDKVAINFQRVVFASPVVRFDDHTQSMKICTAVNLDGAEKPLVLGISYEDFVFAWNQAITPAPTYIVKGAGR